MGMHWTRDRVDELKKLWDENLSASQIASELRGVSRSAVLGKVHRMGLDRRAKNHHFQPRPAPRPWAPRPDFRIRKPHVNFSPVAPTPPPEPHVVDCMIPAAQRRTLLQLTDDTCRWPVGDPGTPGFFFCGARPIGEKPYCPAHCRMAYEHRPRGPVRAWREAAE